MHMPKHKRKPRSPTPKLPFHDRLSLDITETARKLGLGRNTIYSLIKAGKLTRVKFGARSGVTTDSIRALLGAEAAYPVALGQWLKVDDMVLGRHVTSGGDDSVVVEYVCGVQRYREWVLFEHGGLVRAKAEAWWSLFGGAMPAPKKIDEALGRAGELAIPQAITIARDGKYWRVNNYRIERRPRQLIEADEKFRIKAVEREGVAA